MTITIEGFQNLIVANTQSNSFGTVTDSQVADLKASYSSSSVRNLLYYMIGKICSAYIMLKIGFHTFKVLSRAAITFTIGYVLSCSHYLCLSLLETVNKH